MLDYRPELPNRFRLFFLSASKSEGSTQILILTVEDLLVLINCESSVQKLNV